jgi:hypothetical protein
MYDPKYRAVFMGTPTSLGVLADMLIDLHFGCTLDPSNPVQIAEYNLGIVILAKCGVFHPDGLADVVNALSSVIPKPEPESEDT